MFTDSRKRGFTPIEVLVVVVIIVLIVALLLPSIEAARETARRNSCSRKLGQLGQSLHKRAGFYKRFPPVSFCNVAGDTLYGGCPAFVNAGSMSTADPHVAKALSDISPGYSWIVQLLPYMDETPLYEAIKSASADFSLAPWNPKVVIRDAAGKSVHPATTGLDALVCPSFTGDPKNSEDSPYPQKTYAISNYVAIAATNYHRMNTPPYAGTAALEPNGVISQNAKTGVRLSAMADGTSKTLMLSESREGNMAVWFDGAVNWGVAVAPESTSTAPSRQPDSFLGYPIPYTAGVKLSIAQIGNDFTATRYYMSGGKVAGINDAWL